MPRFRYRDEESLAQSLGYVVAGAVAGFAVGVLVSHKVGGVGRITDKLRARFGHAADVDDEEAYAPDEYDEDFDEIGVAGTDTRPSALARDGGARAAGDTISVEEELLEQNVLEAFRNDPILSERPIDISAISDAVVELTGWVNEEQEATHAVTVARGVPGVGTVVNRLAVKPEEDRLDEFAERYADGDPTLTEGHWEGNHVGTGRRRQGNSAEPDRHADPRPKLEERWTREDAAIADAAGEVAGNAQRARAGRGAKRGGRTDGSPVAPTGVPKSDHVADPENAPPRAD